MEITVGDFIIDRLKAIGITEIIGVPGDFNLSFLEQIDRAAGIRFVGACNELNAAYAADGYARQRGVGAVLTTYGVGELSALNGIAGASSEHVPVISLAGAPPQYATEFGWHLHHSLADGDFSNMLTAIAPFTTVATRLSPANAVDEVDRALRTCLREKRPVHIQIPSDITHLTIQVPDAPFAAPRVVSDPERLATAVKRVSQAIMGAHAPVVLVDQDTQRYGFTEPLRAIVDALQLQYCQLTTGKAIFSECDPLFLGTYNGSESSPGVQERVESADLVVTTNPRFTELNSGSFSHNLRPERVLNIGDQHVNIGGEFIVGLNTLDMLEALVQKCAQDCEQALQAGTALVATAAAPAGAGESAGAAAPAGGAEPAGDAEPSPAFSPQRDAALTQERIWAQCAQFVREGDVVIAEAGTANIGLGAQALPDGVSYINSSIWGAIGFTLPALLGSQLAQPSRRHLLFIGDGSFQLTAQELSTILREQLNPIIVLVNNQGYTIERYILGMERAYNDIADWDYTGLLKVFKPDTSMVAYSARTEGELADAVAAISAAGDGVGAFLEVHLEAQDAPRGLKSFGPATADFDYGPRGPRNG